MDYTLLSKEHLVSYTQNLSPMPPATIEAFEDPYYDNDTGAWKVFKKTLGCATAYPLLPSGETLKT